MGHGQLCSNSRQRCSSYAGGSKQGRGHAHLLVRCNLRLLSFVFLTDALLFTIDQVQLLPVELLYTQGATKISKSHTVLMNQTGHWSSHLLRGHGDFIGFLLSLLLDEHHHLLNLLVCLHKNTESHTVISPLVPETMISCRRQKMGDVAPLLGSWWRISLGALKNRVMEAERPKQLVRRMGRAWTANSYSVPEGGVDFKYNSTHSPTLQEYALQRTHNLYNMQRRMFTIFAKLCIPGWYHQRAHFGPLCTQDTVNGGRTNGPHKKVAACKGLQGDVKCAAIHVDIHGCRTARCL
jgi:hypothetical protein